MENASDKSPCASVRTQIYFSRWTYLWLHDTTVWRKVMIKVILSHTTHK